MWSNASAPRSDTSSCGVKQELDPRVLASLVEDAPHTFEHRDDGRLVVGAEDRRARVAHDAVLVDDRVDRGLRRHRVRVCAEEDRCSVPSVRRRDAAVDVPRVSVEARGRVVLVPLEPELGQVRRYAIRDGALAPGGARQGTELEEEIERRRAAATPALCASLGA